MCGSWTNSPWRKRHLHSRMNIFRLHCSAKPNPQVKSILVNSNVMKHAHVTKFLIPSFPASLLKLGKVVFKILIIVLCHMFPHIRMHSLDPVCMLISFVWDEST
jgi:hypothetical protein